MTRRATRRLTLPVTRGVRDGLLAALVCGQLACIQAGITITPPPPVIDPPIPDAFAGDAAPELEDTDTPDLQHAPSINAHLYFYAPDELWYRYKYNRWYQAFSWNGNWFVPARVPDVLIGREPVRSWSDVMPLDPNAMPVDEHGLPDPDGKLPGERQQDAGTINAP